MKPHIRLNADGSVIYMSPSWEYPHWYPTLESAYHFHRLYHLFLGVVAK